MRLKEFSYETEDIRRPPILSFFAQTGSFHLNNAAIRMTKAKEGFYIKFFHNDTSNEWYIAILEKKSDYALWLKKYERTGLVFNKKQIVEHLIRSMNIPEGTNKLNITGPVVIEDIEYYKLSL